MTETGSRPDGKEAETIQPREFLKYTFYRVRPEWRLLPLEDKKRHGHEFATLLHELDDEVTIRCYSLTGVRADTDFMVWAIDRRLETFRDIARRIASTELGHHLDTAYAYLAASKRSVYLGGHEDPGEERAVRVPLGSRYLFVYPFTKKREWYAIPFERRRDIMREHFLVGHKYPSVKIHTGYSFGIDDQEFVLAFESDEPLDFQDLVMELRSSDASRYTERETPIFTCLLATPESMLEALGT
ncbi:MAG: chlorite dismutase family protein [Methanobacteriota archaeon]